MPKTFSNMDELKKYLQPKIKEALQGKVAEKVKKVEQKNINQTVYDAYKPEMYVRRGDIGGLADMENMTVTPIGDDTIEIRNETPLNPIIYVDEGDSYKRVDLSGGDLSDLDKVVEYGEGYMFHKKGAAYLNPRPFTKNTHKDLKEHGQHVDAMKRALKDAGLNVEVK